MEEKDNRCPSQEELSEYYDLLRSGKAYEPLAVRLGGHVASCAACRKTVDAYRRLDQLIAQAAEPPENLSVQIKAHCREQSDLDEMRRLTFGDFRRGLLVKAAAVLALLGIGYAFINSGDTDRMSAEIAKAAGRQPAVAQAPQVPDASAQHAQPGHAAIAPQELRTVSLGRQRPAMQEQHTQGAELAGDIRQVWMVDDLAESADVLRKLAADAGVEARIGKSDGRVVATLSGIEDRKLQALVGNLAARNWALVSPMEPQPGHAVALRGRKVFYTLCMVKKVK